MSSVNNLWVYNCSEQFLYLGLFGSMWSFLCSSSQVLVHLIGICSFLVLVCHEWRWISWTRIHVFHHILAFSSLISFLVSFWVVRCVFPLWGLPRVLPVLLSYRLSIQPFCYAFLVAIFSSQIVRFLWRLVVGMFLCHALPIVDKIFFCCFGMSCFVCIVDISLVSLLSPESSGLFPQVVLLFFLVLTIPFSSHIFQDLSVLPFWPVFVDFLSGFPVELPILVLTVSSCFLKGPQFSHTLISPLHRLDHLSQIYYLLICKVACDLLFVSVLSVLHSMFLNNGRVVFKLFIILLGFLDLSVVLVTVFQ